MDFALNEEQRSWQLKARKFAEQEIRPISLARDQIADAVADETKRALPARLREIASLMADRLADPDVIAALTGKDLASGDPFTGNGAAVRKRRKGLDKKDKHILKDILKNGPLLTNGYANIFYVRDANGVLRAVSVYWYDGGWDEYAVGVAHPNTWFDGRRVFSRNS